MPALACRRVIMMSPLRLRGGKLGSRNAAAPRRNITQRQPACFDEDQWRIGAGTGRRQWTELDFAKALRRLKRPRNEPAEIYALSVLSRVR